MNHGSHVTVALYWLCRDLENQQKVSRKLRLLQTAGFPLDSTFLFIN